MSYDMDSKHYNEWFEKEFDRPPEPEDKIIGKFMSNDIRFFAQEWGEELDNCVTKILALKESKIESPAPQLPAPYIKFITRGIARLEINYNRARDGGVVFSFQECDKAILEAFGDDADLGHCWVQFMELEFRMPSFAMDIGIRVENAEITPGSHADVQARLLNPKQGYYRGLETVKLYNPITGATYNILDFNYLGRLHSFTNGYLRPTLKKKLSGAREIDIAFGERFIGE